MKIITILRKPLDKTIVHNVLTHGCGGLNIDDCRVGGIVQDTSKNGRSSDSHKNTVYKSGLKDNVDGRITVGRWPANFFLIRKEGYPCPIEELDRQSGNLKSGKDVNPTREKVSGFFGKKDNYYSSISNYGDEGGASRFFKQFKKEDNP